MSLAAKRTTPLDEGGAANVVALPVRASSPAPGAAGAGDPAGGEDGELLARLAAGDKAAFAMLMQRHLSAVLASARRILGDASEAEDIAQEAFLRLWNGAATLEAGPTGMRPWLRRVASNLAIDRLRKARRLDVTDDVPEQVDEADQLRALEATEASMRVEEALAALPPRQRIAINLFHFDEMSQREVAEVMELSEDALESLLARGRRRLRELLKEDWQGLLIQSNGGP